jgi:hypothetical protein
MSINSLGQPDVYKDSWYIFNDATIDHIEYDDCNDTVNGKCENTKDIEECIRICDEAGDDHCDMGYFIKTPDKKQNYCVPIRKIPKNVTFPFFRVKRKALYPELKNVDSKIFIRKNQHTFPPNIANVMFYRDTFVIENVKTGLQVGFSNSDTLHQEVIFNKKSSLHAQFLPALVFRTAMEKYVSVKNGIALTINIPNTSIILRKQPNSMHLSWLFHASSAYVPNNTITINCEYKKYDEPLNYADTIYFTYFEQLVYYDPETQQLAVSNTTVDEAKKDGLFYEFKLIPKIIVYYCENNTCKQATLGDCVPNGVQARYNGIMVWRNSSCFGICEKPVKNNKSFIILSIVILVSILVAILVSIKS